MKGFWNDLGKKLGFGKDEEGQGGDAGGEGKAYKCATCGSESKGEAGTCCGAPRQGQ